MYRPLNTVLVGCVAMLVYVGSASAQQVDAAFAPAFRVPCTAQYPSSTTTALRLLPDGSVLNVGPVYAVDGAPRAALRTLEDGTIDSAWGAQALRGWNATSVAQHGDSAFVMLYRRTEDNVSRVLRVFADGTIDTSFASEPFGRGITITVSVDAAQRIVVAGRFVDASTGTTVAALRLTPLGAIDTTFTPPSIGKLYATGVNHLRDGSMLLWGSFDGLGGTSARSIARLDETGIIDTTFSATLHSSDVVVDALVLPDGGILMASTRESERNGGTLRILEPNGQLRTDAPAWNVADKLIRGVLPIDSTTYLVYGSAWVPFRDEQSVWYATVTLTDTAVVDRMGDERNLGRVGAAVRLQDGSTVISGSFRFVGRRHRPGYARLTSSFTLDESFAVPCTVSGPLSSVITRADGSVVASGYIAAIGSITTGPMVVMDEAGNLAAVQDRYQLSSYWFGQSGLDVQGADSTGRLYAIRINQANRTGHGDLVRLLPDGALDTTYRLPSGLDVAIRHVCPLPDGRAYVSGFFTKIGDAEQRYLARLLPDGSLDTTFALGEGIGTDVDNPGAEGVVSPVRAMALVPEGGLVIAGRINAYDGVAVTNVARLGTDGRRDATFTPNLRLVGTISNDINHIVVLSDASVVIGGAFSQANDVVNSSILRLSNRGVLDRDYAPDVSRLQGVMDVCGDRNGNIYIAGKGILRIRPDGFVDDVPFVATDDYVYSMALQGDSALVFVGAFTRAGNAAMSHIGRVFVDRTTSAGTSAAVAQPLVTAPSPVESVLWIHLPEHALGTDVRVVNGIGRIVWRGQAAASPMAIPFHELSPGLYIVSVGTQSTTVLRR